MRHKKKKEQVPILGIIGLIVALGAVAVLGVYVYSTFQVERHMDTYTFTRDISLDHGRALNPEEVKAAGDILAHSLFATKRRGWEDLYHGAQITFRMEYAGELIKSTQIKIDNPAQQGDNPARRRYVAEKETEFNTALASFQGEQKVVEQLTVVVDTTEGTGEKLRRRVMEVAQDKFAKMPNNVVVQLYTLDTETWKGNRIKFAAPNTSDNSELVRQLTSLLKKPPTASSSVLQPLAGILHDAIDNDDDLVLNTFVIFTDGLENTKEYSVLTNPGDLEPEKWENMDPLWNPTLLKLKAAKVHIYPLPHTNPATKQKMDKALAYLENRLTAAGGKVNLAPF